MNATVKSGTNEVHGDLWEYLRNDKLDAANFFENAYGSPKGAYRQNQFGGTVGGPVMLPHLYDGRNIFLFDYQGTRIRQAAPSVGTVPTSSMRDSGYTNLQDLITYNSGTRSDSLGRTFPIGTVFDPATTRNVTAGQIDPITGLTATATGLARDPFFTGGLAGVTDFTTAGNRGLLNLIPANRLDANAIKLLNIYPLATTPGVVNNFSYDPSAKNDTNQFDVRVDHNFGGSDRLFGVASWSHWIPNNPSPLPGIANGQAFGSGAGDFLNQAYAFSYTHLFSPTLINEFHAGYNRNLGNLEANEANQMGIPAQFGIQGVPQVPGNGGLPAINIAGLSGLGIAGWYPTLTLTQVREFADNLTKVYGSHTIKTGVQIDRIRGGITQPAFSHGAFNFYGVYTGVPYQGGPGIAEVLLMPVASSVPGGYDFVGGANSVYASNFASTDDVRGYYGVYLQDDWKVTPRLTLNLGLRWDYFQVYQEKYGAQANLLPGAPPGNGAKYLITKRRCGDPRSASFNSLTAADGIQIECGGNALGVPQNLNLAPRLGFVYRATSRMVIRGGYGISYGGLANKGYGGNLGGNYPFLCTFGFNAPDAAHPLTFPNGSIATLGNGLSGIELSPAQVNAQGLGLIGREYHYKTPAFQSFNLTVQYQLSPSQSIQAGYVGDLTRHEDTFTGNNLPSVMLPPGLNPQSYVPFPDFSRGSLYEATSVTTNYHFFQTTYQRTFSNGLTWLANYTYSQCMTNFKPGVGGTLGGYRAPFLPNFSIKGDYAPCDQDTTHVIHSSRYLPIADRARQATAP